MNYFTWAANQRGYHPQPCDMVEPPTFQVLEGELAELSHDEPCPDCDDIREAAR